MHATVATSGTNHKADVVTAPGIAEVGDTLCQRCSIRPLGVGIKSGGIYNQLLPGNSPGKSSCRLTRESTILELIRLAGPIRATLADAVTGFGMVMVEGDGARPEVGTAY